MNLKESAPSLFSIRLRKQIKDYASACRRVALTRPVGVLIGVVVVAAIAVWVAAGVLKGNSGFDKKTLWDWLDLLLVPTAIALGIFLLNASEKSRDRTLQIETNRRELLDRYYSRMQDLILSHGLLSSTSGDAAQSIAQALTYSVVRELDGNRKGDLLRFLQKAGLIKRGDTKVPLVSADFKGAVLVNTPLEDAELSHCQFRGANFRGARLIRTNLFASDMGRTIMRGAWFQETVLIYANFDDADLEGAEFDGAEIHHTDFFRANLRKARFLSPNGHLKVEGKPIVKRDAVVDHAGFIHANLDGALLSEEQMQDCQLLGATMPNGESYADWLRSQSNAVKEKRAAIDKQSLERLADLQRYKREEAASETLWRSRPDL